MRQDLIGSYQVAYLRLGLHWRAHAVAQLAAVARVLTRVAVRSVTTVGAYCRNRACAFRWATG